MNFLIGHVFSLMALVSSLRLMEWPPLNCTQEVIGAVVLTVSTYIMNSVAIDCNVDVGCISNLRCSADISDCLDGYRWVRPRIKTPTGPLNSELQVAARRDEKGDLVPVMTAKWRTRTDGSILTLKGTKVHVLQKASNQSFCVYYVFHNGIKQMLNPRNVAWSFSLDGIVVDPGQTYLVSISNLPVPRDGHNKIDRTFTVPGCRDPKLRETKVCRENGSRWEPNITWNVSSADAVMTVRFNSDEYSEKYTVSVQCPDFSVSQTVWKGDETTLNVTFAMGQWPATCCSYDIEILPFFIQCSDGCARREKFKNCTNDPRYSGGWVFIILFLALLVGCGCLALCRKTLTGSLSVPAPTSKPACPQEPLPLSTPRKVLLIYSLDHPLYRDVVLKLCAFLRAKCGTEVVLDLLDSAWLGAVGRMQWLDWQKQQIEKSSDKILILCSRGVRAKWRAMCGEHRVMLREDLRSPMGDMLTPALNLIVPDVVHCTSFQKYIVAYFEDVSCEEDVPAPFNVTIKYKLMKHFEELYFRILDQEKHEPGRVNRIEGIAQDDYFKCPSGRALRDAIETLQAYQLENADWFEKECVDCEEEVAESEPQSPLLSNTCRNPIFQHVPEIQEGPPILVNEVQFIEDARGVRALIPLVNQGGEELSTYQLHPEVNPGDNRLCYSHPVVEADPPMSKWSLRPSASEGQPCSRNDATPQEPPTPMWNTFHSQREAEWSSFGERFPSENRDEAPTSTGRLSPTVLCRLQALQSSFGLAEDIDSVPVGGVADHRNRPPSGSDQGYISISRSPHRQDSTNYKSQNPLEALARLQEACLLNSLKPPSGDMNLD